MIGIVSSNDDVHALAVRQHLDSLGAEHLLMDTSYFPTRVELTTTQQPATGWTGRWVVEQLDHDLARLGAMWWRRPQPFALHDAMTNGEDRAFAHGECAAMVAGLWDCLDAEWVNDPDRDEAASRKMRQLRLATEVGLRVPRTCMTNSPEKAREFIAAEPGEVVYKSFSATARTWRETRPVRRNDLELIDRVALAPVIFQEAIPPGVDVRVTITGDDLFAAEIRPGEAAYEYDFRVDQRPRIAPHELPARVEKRLLHMMQRFGLRYGAVDLRRAPDGDYVFLEINPAGQWLFVEVATGQPISRSLAAMLVRLDLDLDRNAP